MLWAIALSSSINRTRIVSLPPGKRGFALGHVVWLTDHIGRYGQKVNEN